MTLPSPVNAKGAVPLPDGGIMFLPFDCEACAAPSCYRFREAWLCSPCYQLDFLAGVCDNRSVS